MKFRSVQTISFISLCLLIVGIFFVQFLDDWSLPKTDVQKMVGHNKVDKKTRADLAAEREWMMTRDLETGEIPRGLLMEAKRRLRDILGRQEKAAIGGITWVERGPDNVGGRTRALLFDPNDSQYKTVYAGSVSGGLWKSTDFFAADPEWTEIDPFLENLAITALVTDPSSSDTWYMGTGEGFYNSDAVKGDGIFKSTDGGDTWTQLSSTTGSSFDYVQKIVVASNGDVIAATRDGVQRSTNGGSSWTKVLGSSTGGGSTNRIGDLEIDANGNIWAAAGIFSTDGVYKSNNNGVSWTKKYTSTSAQERIEIACAPSDSDRVYIVLQNDHSRNADKVKKSTDGGDNWSNISVPVDDVNSDTFTRQQGWYDLILCVDPNDEDNVLMGGIDLYKSTNAGTSWTEISHWYGGASLPEVHADQHQIIFKPGSSDTVIFGNDGGVYFSKNISVSSPSFTHQINGYNTVQYYSCAVAPAKNQNYFLAGSQDNGSHQFSSAGVNSTVEVTGGDGAFAHIDQDDDDYQFTSYIRNQYRKSTNGGSSFSNVNFDDSIGMFINPTDYDNDAQKLYASYGTGGYYLVWTNPRSGSSYSTVSAGMTGEISAVTCDPNTSNRVYFGTNAGKIYRVNDAASSPSVSDITGGSMPSGYVSCIAVEDGDDDHLLVTFSNYSVSSVWESTDGGSNWTDVEGNLLDMPVRWALFSPIGGDSALIATELGVWSTTDLDGSSTSWATTNSGLANVRVDMLQLRPADSMVIAATHGRGLFSSSNFSNSLEPDFEAQKTLAYVGEKITFSDNSIGATSWEWDFDEDGIYDASGSEVEYAFNESGNQTVILRINGTDTAKKSDYIQVLPNVAVPYSTSDGGDFESNADHFGSAVILGTTNLWERGTPSNYLTNTRSSSNVWKTDLDADIVNGDYECALYTPNFNFSASGNYYVSFYHAMQVYYGNAPFGIQIQYSTDLGETWTRLGDSGDTTNWYNRGSSNPHSVIPDGRSWSYTGTGMYKAVYNASALAGNSSVCFRFFAKVESGWNALGYPIDGFSVDDFSVSGPANSANSNSGGVETEVASKTVDLDANDTTDFYSNSGKLIATVTNLSNSHDYGNTIVEIDQAGGSTSDFDTNTAADKKIFSKTLKITPTTNNGSGVVKIAMYFTNAEFTSWKTATGLWGKDLQLFKTTNAIGSSTIAQGVNPDSASVDTTYNGNDICLIGYFSNGFSGVGAGGGSGGGGPLPVQFLDFSGEWLNSFIQLNWTTASEVNNDYFEIHRKSGIGSFEPLGKLDGAGNSSGILTYQFEDYDIHLKDNTYFYRLKQVDFDGAETWSDVVAVQRPINEVEVDIYPNPFSSNIKLDVITRKAYYAKLVNLQGTVVQQIRFRTSTEWNTNGLSPGMYFLEITEKGRIVSTQKVLKQ
jgi:hypothetical protein